MTAVVPVPGLEIVLDRAASVQFSAVRPSRFRITRVLDYNPPWGWVWLAGYQLGAAGSAVAQREVMVRLDGIREALHAPSVPKRPRVPGRKWIPVQRHPQPLSLQEVSR